MKLALRSGKNLATVTDFLVIGGGVIGLSIAREIKKRFNGASVTLSGKGEC